MSSTFVATASLERAPLQDGSVLYDPKSGKFVMLNRAATFLWTQVSTPRTEDELFHLLGAAFPQASIPRQHVTRALEELQRMELVAPNGETSAGGASPRAADDSGREGRETQAGYEEPSLRVLDEEELLSIFQMTAAEISVASCWWGACSVGCP